MLKEDGVPVVVVVGSDYVVLPGVIQFLAPVTYDYPVQTIKGANIALEHGASVLVGTVLVFVKRDCQYNRSVPLSHIPDSPAERQGYPHG